MKHPVTFFHIFTTILDTFDIGSTTIIIPPLTVIEKQLKDDCLKYGIKALVGSEVSSECSGTEKAPNSQFSSKKVLFSAPLRIFKATTMGHIFQCSIPCTAFAS